MIKKENCYCNRYSEAGNDDDDNNENKNNIIMMIVIVGDMQRLVVVDFNLCFIFD